MNKREFVTAFVLAHPFYDMEDTVGAASRLYDAIVAATPTAADEGWIEHRGEKPYPEGLVEVQRRSGAVWGDDADEFIWAWDPDLPEADIVAWRPAR